MALILSFSLFAANFKQVAYFPHGSWGYPLITFDTDHNGKDEIFFHSYGDTGTMVYEHTASNQYTASRLYGKAITAIGLGDTDSLTDAFGRDWTPPSLVDPIGIYESRNHNSYPDTLVCYIADSTLWGPLGYFVDFDQDGQMNLITTYSDINVVRHFCIFENTENNSYTMAFEYLFPTSGPGDMAIEDFDNDGLAEIICGDIDGKVYVFENTAIGIDSFHLVWTYQLPSYTGAAYMAAKGNDMDRDGRLEFIVGAEASGTGKGVLAIFESNGNNSYQKAWQKIFQYSGYLMTYGDVDCGDIDGDGIDEAVSFIGLVLNVWKCVGPDSFVSIWDKSFMYDVTDGVLEIADLNQNGLGEIVVSGGNWGSTPPAKTYIYEKMPSVTWIYPAQYDTLWANDTVNLLWKLDETVSLESLRIYIAHPLMGCWLVYQGLPADTTCLFVVPDTQSNMAFRFWVAVEGYLRYDSIVSPPFYIKRRTGIEETANPHFAFRIPHLEVYPNPFWNYSMIKFEIRNPKSEINSNDQISLKIYDATGRLVRQWDYESARQSNQIIWFGDDDLGSQCPPGVYFLYLRKGSFSALKKIIKFGR
jgi:hypothetical protein